MKHGRSICRMDLGPAVPYGVHNCIIVILKSSHMIRVFVVLTSKNAVIPNLGKADEVAWQNGSCFKSTGSQLNLRGHLVLWDMRWPQSYDMVTPLRPRYISCSYMKVRISRLQRIPPFPRIPTLPVIPAL